MPSGAGKSPAMHAVMSALEDAQSMEFARYAAEVEAANTKTGEGEAADVRPVRRFVLNDVTAEGTQSLLADNPRGVILKRGELAGFFGGMDRHVAGKRGGDRAFWLECWDGKPYTVDRKNRAGSLFIRACTLSILGAIQPAVLRGCLSAEDWSSGLVARFLLAAPPGVPRTFDVPAVPDLVRERYRAMIGRLLAIDLIKGESNLVRFDADGARRFKPWYEQFANAPGDDAPRSKAVSYAARLAVVLELAASDGPDGVRVVTEPSVVAGVKIAEWALNEQRRLYAAMREEGQASLDERVLAAVAAADGEVTARDIYLGKLGKGWQPEDVKASLERLYETGQLWRTERRAGPKGGRPTVYYSARAPVVS